MIVYLLSDPHLGKDMTPFGECWVDHVEKIAERWRATVRDDRDVVCVPGDISWARTLDDARPHLDWFEALPGRKIFVRGNHDWWWRSTSQVREVLPPSLIALDSDAIALDGVIFAGAKGYLSPNDPYFRPDRDETPYDRNLRRVRHALEEARELRITQGLYDAPIVFCLHYPPCTSNGDRTAFADLVEGKTDNAPAVEHCVFGHFHMAREWKVCLDGPTQSGTHYHLGSVDYLDFTPKPILTID